MQKESLSIITVKTLLAVVIFTGIGTIIIGGGYLIGDYYKNKNAIEDKMIKPVVREVTITTDKTEYKQGENTIITIRNNFDKNIYYYENIYCYLEYQKENGIWVQSLIINMPCSKGEIKGLDSFKSTNRTLYFTGNNHIYYSGGGKYRLAFSYGYSNKNTKEKTIYSNEFTIKEKSAFDSRCSEKVKGIGPCEMVQIGYEFSSIAKKCVINNTVDGCSVESPFNSLEECREVCEENNKEVKYQIFSTGLGIGDKEEIIDYAYIYKNDKLPKTIEIEDNIITVQKIEIQKTGGFMAYVTILHNDKEKKIGFWHPDGKIQNKENGCLDRDNKQVCGGELAMNIKKWTEESTKEEKEKNILYVTYLKRFSLQEIDYDFNSDDWNYIKIILSLYRGPNYLYTIF